MDCEIDSPNFGYRRVLISRYKKEIQCFKTGAGYFTWSGQPVFLPIFNMAINDNNFSSRNSSAFLSRYLIISITASQFEINHRKWSIQNIWRWPSFCFISLHPRLQERENHVNCSAELETLFSQLSMNLNINRSAFRICPQLNLVFKIGHLLGGQILKSSLPIITMEAGQVVS